MFENTSLTNARSRSAFITGGEYAISASTNTCAAASPVNRVGGMAGGAPDLLDQHEVLHVVPLCPEQLENDGLPLHLTLVESVLRLGGHDAVPFLKFGRQEAGLESFELRVGVQPVTGIHVSAEQRRDGVTTHVMVESSSDRLGTWETEVAAVDVVT
jgi:hypothetical protein